METNPIIEAQRAKIAAQRAELQISEAVLRGMELVEASYSADKPAVAAKRSAPPKPAQQATNSAKVAGKPQGSISMNWRTVLNTFYAHNDRFSAAEVVARENLLHGRMLRSRAVRRLFEGYAALGFIEIGGDSLYRVTDTAAARFGFDRAPLAERLVNEAEDASEGDTSASSLFSNQERQDHAATIMLS